MHALRHSAPLKPFTTMHDENFRRIYYSYTRIHALWPGSEVVKPGICDLYFSKSDRNPTWAPNLNYEPRVGLYNNNQI